MKLLFTILLIFSSNIFANETLRQIALDKGLDSVPNSFESIKKLFNNSYNPITLKKIKLGKKLFNDKNLSLSRKISCASCHDIKNGGEDGSLLQLDIKKEKIHTI